MPEISCCRFTDLELNSKYKSIDDLIVDLKVIIMCQTKNNPYAMLYLKSNMPSNFDKQYEEIPLLDYESLLVIKPKKIKNRPSKKLRDRIRNQAKKKNEQLVQEFQKNLKKRLENEQLEKKRLENEQQLEKERLEKKRLEKEQQLEKENLMLECPICLEKINQENKLIKYLKCGHLLHAFCYEKLLEYEPSCPCCRTPINRDSEDFINFFS